MIELDGLLQRLDQASGAAASAEPEPEPALAADCERLADVLLGLGATAAAARWRTLALLSPSPGQLAAALDDAREQLARLGLPAGDGSVNPPSADPLAAARRAVAGQGSLPPASQVAVWARALLAAGEGSAAVELLQRQAHGGGLQPDHCNAVASALLQQEQWWEAERWLCTSLTHHRNQPRPWFQLARLLLQQGVLDEALEAVQQGLALDPRSDWGRNLRGRILLEGGSWRSYDLLAASPEALPDDPAPRRDLQEQRRRWSRQGLGSGPMKEVSLSHRLQWRRLLQPEGLVVLLHGHHGDPLCWCRGQELLPEAVPVQPVASREPLLLAEALGRAGFLARPEQPAPLLAQLAGDGAEAVELLVIQRPLGSRLPVSLGALLLRVKHLLVPAGLLLPPPRFTPLAQLGGWQLLTADL